MLFNFFQEFRSKTALSMANYTSQKYSYLLYTHHSICLPKIFRPFCLLPWVSEVLFQFEDLQECYLLNRKQLVSQQKSRQLDLNSKKDKYISNKGIGNVGLEDFQSILNAFTRYRFVPIFTWHVFCWIQWILLVYDSKTCNIYSRVRVIAEVRQGDLFHSSNIVSR